MTLFLAPPSYEGGDAVSEYDVIMTNPDNTTREVYRGRECECVVAGLLPGRPYLFQVRPINKAGVRSAVSANCTGRSEVEI